MASRKALAEIKTLRRLLYEAFYLRGVGLETKRNIIDAFHGLFYDSSAFGGTWQDTRWLGVPIKKCAFDLWIYQELLFELRPDLIIETGTADGGSALFFASLFDLLQNGTVVTIDIESREGRPKHERIRYVQGSSTSAPVLKEVEAALVGQGTTLVTLDSDHSYGHVMNELEIYSRYVTPDSYIVVEDSNVNGHPVKASFGPGPMEAIQSFLKAHPEFEADRQREKFYLTFNPSGYLRRLRA